MLSTRLPLLLLLLGAAAAAPAPGASSAVDEAWARVRELEANDAAFLLAHKYRELGQSYRGATNRLRLAVSKLIHGQPFTLGLIGGSVTEGGGATEEHPSWGVRLLGSLKALFPDHPSIRLVNGARGATTSGYMSLCIGEHAPPEADMIIVEYAVNDPAYECGDPVGPTRRALERLVRSCLAYPNNPPVIVFNYYAYFRTATDPGKYWDNAEHVNTELQLYYQLPALSLKAAVWPLFHQGDDGLGARHFRVDGWRSCLLKDGRCSADACELQDCGLGRHRAANDSFYFDRHHPMGATGHRAMSDLALHLVVGAVKDVLARPVGEEDTAEAAAALPAPMLPGNYEQAATACVFGERFRRLAATHEGWEWVDEGRDPRRPKWGWVAATPSAQLTFTLDTRRGVGDTSAAAGGADMALGVALLHSYEHMGAAHLACVSGCRCGHLLVNLTLPERRSPILTHTIGASPHAECIVAVTVSDQPGPGGGFKVKVVGATVSAMDQPEGLSGYALDFLGANGLAARVDADGYRPAQRPAGK